MDYSDGCTFQYADYTYSRFSSFSSSTYSGEKPYVRVSVTAAYGCQEQFETADGCEITVAGTDLYGVKCNSCDYNGTTVKMVDCSNVPDDDIEFASTPQSLQVEKGGGFFEATDVSRDLCLPFAYSATATVTRSGPSSEDSVNDCPQKKKDVPSKDFTIPAKLQFAFSEGTGQDADPATLAHLMIQTLAFFNAVLFGNPTYECILLDVNVEDVHTEYDELTSPDELIVKFTVHVNIMDEKKSKVTLRGAITALAEADWNHYLAQYVHDPTALLLASEEVGSSTESKASGIFDHVEKVVFHGVGSGERK